MDDRKILLISNYNAVRRPWNGVMFEFFDVISRIEHTRIVAPPARVEEIASGTTLGGVIRYAGRELDDRARRALGLRIPGGMRETRLDDEYDLCLCMFQFTRNLVDVAQVRDWRARSRFAAVFLLESWSSQLEKHRAALRLLDEFDHVFVLNAGSIPALRRYTSTPISFLPTAADSLTSCPVDVETPRPVDVLSMGRRRPEVHAALIDLVRERDLFYVYDIWHNVQSRDWAEVRAFNANITRRAKYYVAWDPVAVSPKKDDIIGNDRAISTRYFEGSAGGSILLGSKPDCPEFDDLFDWPDAVVDIAPDGTDLRTVLDTFEADPARARAVRTNNAVNALRRHDWSDRWARILDTFELSRTPAHEARAHRLEHLARKVEMDKVDAGAYKVLSE